MRARPCRLCAAPRALERCPVCLGTEKPSVLSRRPCEGLGAQSAAGWGGRCDAMRSYTWRQGCTPRCCGGLDLASAAEERLSVEDPCNEAVQGLLWAAFCGSPVAPLPRLSPYVRATLVAGCDCGKRWHSNGFAGFQWRFSRRNKNNLLSGCPVKIYDINSHSCIVVSGWWALRSIAHHWAQPLSVTGAGHRPVLWAPCAQVKLNSVQPGSALWQQGAPLVHY